MRQPSPPCTHNQHSQGGSECCVSAGQRRTYKSLDGQAELKVKRRAHSEKVGNRISAERAAAIECSKLSGSYLRLCLLGTPLCEWTQRKIGNAR